MSSWIGVVGTALGAAIGAGSTLFAQKISFSRQERSEHKRTVREKTASFMAGTHEIYTHIVDVRRNRRSGGGDDTYLQALSSVSPKVCQTVLEELRMLAPSSITRAAENLWEHLRSNDVPRGRDLSSKAWDEWKAEYWTLRKNLVDQAKVSFLPSATP